MAKKPLIGLNSDFRSARRDSPAFGFLCSGYYDAISEMGGVPVVIPPLREEDDIHQVLDAFILAGPIIVCISSKRQDSEDRRSCSDHRGNLPHTVAKILD